jgi:hypothetical protein
MRYQSIILLFSAVLLFSCDAGHRSIARARAGTNVGQPFPPFSGSTLQGERLDNSVFRDRVTLVSAWRVGCEWSQVEIAEYNRLRETITDRRFQMISMAPQTEEELQQFYGEPRDGTIHAPAYPVVPMCRETDEISEEAGRCTRLEELIGAEVYPITFIVGPDGTIRHRHDGLLVDATTFEPDMSVFRQELDSLLRVL